MYNPDGRCRRAYMWVRSAPKPECISAATDRATARAARSAGHSLAAGTSSARYSLIASESQTVTSGWPGDVLAIESAGTLPVGEQFL